MKKLNKTGPSTDPWGTQLVTGLLRWERGLPCSRTQEDHGRFQVLFPKRGRPGRSHTGKMLPGLLAFIRMGMTAGSRM